MFHAWSLKNCRGISGIFRTFFLRRRSLKRRGTGGRSKLRSLKELPSLTLWSNTTIILTTMEAWTTSCQLACQRASGVPSDAICNCHGRAHVVSFLLLGFFIRWPEENEPATRGLRLARDVFGRMPTTHNKGRPYVGPQLIFSQCNSLFSHSVVVS